MNRDEAIRRFQAILDSLQTTAEVSAFADALRDRRSIEELTHLIYPKPIAHEINIHFIGEMIASLWPEDLDNLPAELSELLDVAYNRTAKREKERLKAECATRPVWDLQYLIVQARMADADALGDNPPSPATEHLVLFHLAREIELRIDNELSYSSINETVRQIIANSAELGVRLEVEQVTVERGSVLVIIVVSGVSLALGPGEAMVAGAGLMLAGHVAWAASKVVEGALTKLGENVVDAVTKILVRNPNAAPVAPSGIYDPSRESEGLAKMAATANGCSEEVVIVELGKQIGNRLYYIYRFRPADCGARGVRIGLGLTPDVAPYVVVTY